MTWVSNPTYLKNISSLQPFQPLGLFNGFAVDHPIQPVFAGQVTGRFVVLKEPMESLVPGYSNLVFKTMTTWAKCCRMSSDLLYNGTVVSTTLLNLQPSPWSRKEGHGYVERRGLLSELTLLYMQVLQAFQGLWSLNRRPQNPTMVISSKSTQCSHLLISLYNNMGRWVRG